MCVVLDSDEKEQNKRGKVNNFLKLHEIHIFKLNKLIPVG